MKKSIDQDYVRTLAQQYIQTVKSKNKQFSLRAFAKRLDVSAGGMSSFLSGKKSYSSEMLETIIETIVEDPSERQQILKNYNSLKLQKLKDSIRYTPRKGVVLSENEFQPIRDWHYFAFLFLIETHDFRLDPDWIAKRLGISALTVKKTISDLMASKLIALDDSGKLIKNEALIRTSDNTSSKSLRHMHQQMLERAQASIEDVATPLRDLTSVTVSMDPKSINKVRELIRKFHEDLMLLVDQDTKTEVYNCSVSLFPLTKSK
jgi:uncharacterized protein (TIGR02147 family)